MRTQLQDLSAIKKSDLVWRYKVNVKDNADEVYAYLHSKGIHERGEIVSPKREVWFKTWHYIMFNFTEDYALYYKHVNNKKQYQSEPQIELTFEELKQILN